MPRGGAAPRAAGDNRLGLEVQARPQSVAAVRRWLEGMGLPDDLLFEAKLLASELVTNSIRHAKLGPGDPIHLMATWSGDSFRVLVRGGPLPAGTHQVVGSIRPAPDAQSGWGLYLIDRIATRWGTNLGGRPGYWFELSAAVPERG
jgi:anti-sigma regulatory factor (Ser/Thr protein kinase)